MTIQTISSDYSAITTIGTNADPISNTSDLFDARHTEQNLSAIDQYIENCKSINVIWMGSAPISPELSRLLLLGYVSAIESYFRTIFRNIINSDAKTKADVYSYQVSYGAALYHQKSTLPEAFLEGTSFTGSKEIKSALEKYLKIGAVEKNITDMFVIFDKICHMRHCCVHRFGKLGTQNGIFLGLENHKEVIEKPLCLDKDTLGNIASWLMSFTKAINNFIFRKILERSHRNSEYKIDWKWKYSKDKAKFIKIYKIFSSSRDSTPSLPDKEIYGRFRNAMKNR